MTAREMIEQEFTGKLGPQSIFGPDGNIRPGVINAAEQIIERLEQARDTLQVHKQNERLAKEEARAEVAALTSENFLLRRELSFHLKGLTVAKLEGRLSEEVARANHEEKRANDLCREVERLRALLREWVGPHFEKDSQCECLLCRSRAALGEE